MGRFVEVNDNPDELLDAVLDVERNLGSLDLPAGRARLAARYGPDAVTDRLAELYRVERRTPSAPVVPTGTRPERVTLLARRNWRHYLAAAGVRGSQGWPRRPGGDQATRRLSRRRPDRSRSPPRR